MSKQRKHVEEEILTQFPEPGEGEMIVQVKESRGRNTLEVIYPDGNSILALIPAKFQKKIWIKKGNFVIIEPTFLPDSTSKVLAVVTHTLFPEDVQHLIDTDQWPEEFLSSAIDSLNLKTKDDDNEKDVSNSYLNMDFMSDEEDDMGRNPNYNYELDESSSSGE